MSQLQGIVRFTFRDGQVEEFKRLSAVAMDIVRTKEPDTLQYDTYFDADETRAVVLERFRDSQALIDHAANIGPELTEAIMATAEVVEGELLGDLSPELAEQIAGSPVGLLTLYRSLEDARAEGG